MTAFDRYHRQLILPQIGAAGQERLRASTALIVGCGALGTHIADGLARAGVGRLRIVDRDIVELTNLQRQVLFTERDVQQQVPKAEAARRAIAAINSDVAVDAIVDDFNAGSAEQHVAGSDIIIDGLDNFETRYLVNDLAVRDGLAYVYGGAIATTGMSMTILPHSAARKRSNVSRRVQWSDDQATPCLRCLFPEPPPPGMTPTCDTAGILHAAVASVTAHQVAQAMKVLIGAIDRVDRSLWTIDVWSNETRRADVSGARNSDCPCCAAGRFEYAHGSAAGTTTSLCGRNTVQILPPRRSDGTAATLDLSTLADRLKQVGTVSQTDYFVRCTLNGSGDASSGSKLELTVFPDGRVLVHGTSEPDIARTLHARYIGA